jgi:hypothetical protein
MNVSQISLSRITLPTDHNTAVTFNDPTRACKSYYTNSVELRRHTRKIKPNPAHVQHGVHRPQRSADKSCGDQPSPNETLMIFFFFFCRAQRTVG